jgi:hypothetical protein
MCPSRRRPDKKLKATRPWGNPFPWYASNPSRQGKNHNGEATERPIATSRPGEADLKVYDHKHKETTIEIRRTNNSADGQIADICPSLLKSSYSNGGLGRDFFFVRNKYPAIFNKPRSNSVRRVEPTKITLE